MGISAAFQDLIRDEPSKVQKALTAQAHWALRLALASVFLYHGIDKLTALSQFSEMMSLPYPVALLVALAETAGAVLIVAGGLGRDWVTRLGAAFLIPVMLGAIGMVHWGQWAFTSTQTHPMGGAEFQTTLLLLSVYILARGNNA